ncbi:serine hydrolase domain-containing protein, partial [Aquidulcibacter sp.]|uniref:serine hydrolase domain-containing protein n=1 Tax=Aquidulcibacter sp. TaxID=2052990 RepID=UPI0028ABDC55
MQRRAFVSLLGASLGAGLVSPALAAKRKTDPLAGFDAELDLARQNWRVPGLAIAVIKDGAPIYTKGFGWRDGAKTQAVTPDTLFGVASLTKAFTSATVALLVDEGKLAWDEPVTTYLPELKMAGGVEYASLSLFDMLSHRTGLGTHDLVWYNNEKLSKTELLARLPYLDTSAPLRSEYKYNNLMYILAGLVVER